jgi:hypothetical protein
MSQKGLRIFDIVGLHDIIRYRISKRLRKSKGTPNFDLIGLHDMMRYRKSKGTPNFDITIIPKSGLRVSTFGIISLHDTASSKGLQSVLLVTKDERQ